MTPYYFAYGSNMNPARMQARGLSFLSAQAAVLPGYRLRFNKRSHARPHVSYANIEPATGATVEGVLYALETHSMIEKMDVFEGTPVRYSRECLAVLSPHSVMTGASNDVVHAWVYLANPAFIDNNLLPEDQYLQHLIAGAPFLSRGYLDALRRQACQIAVPMTGDAGLKFNA